ncbi:hypothetical protein B0O80DRAFT_502449 [Mortierella sp. GBAus27b]|nr:hypothetical protein B0O80DRAFT_502449 [Mortierella sp. GBAus27b]
MTSSTERALQLPEVLDNIARWIPLFEYSPQTFWTREKGERVYRPRYLLACILVSRLWNTCFTPHLYHYYAQDRFNTNALALERNCHRFRRLLKWTTDYHKPEILFKNLAGLQASNQFSNIGPLLLCNQGPQLRELFWAGSGQQMDTRYMDALMNLPCLEQLHLYHWNLTNEQLYEILGTCSRTLKVLILGRLPECGDCPFNRVDNTLEQPKNYLAGMAPWSLPQLKTLKLNLLDTQSAETHRLLRCCPALEYIDMYISNQRHSISNFTSELREHCHNLQAICLRTFSCAIGHNQNQNPKMEALLFKDGIGPQRLKRAMMSVSRAVDSLMRDALLFHADTLVSLRIECPHYWRQHTMNRLSDDIRNVVRLLTLCRNLKEVELLDYGFKAASIPELLTSPWGCQGLEHLVIKFQPSTTIYSKIPPEPQPLESERKRIRHEAWPRRLRHHEYRDDGQGWYLKPGLSRLRFRLALADGDLKRSIFEHMYNTSGIRKAKYIQLMSTEFFAQEQHFDDMETERKEMVEEEGLVVDYREMSSTRKASIPRGLSTLFSIGEKLWGAR